MPNLDIIEINEKIATKAKQLASGLSEPKIRKRGLIDMLGINCAIDYLREKKLRIDTKRSVHNIPILFEEFKISDIYYGNYRIDVITLYKEKTVKIPKIQIDVDIVPDFYFIVQIGAKIKEAKMIGFIEGKSVLGCSCDSKFYYPTLDLIFDLRRFLYLTKQSTPTRTIIGKHTDCLGMFLKFIDDDLSNVYKSQLIQHLMNCDSCRNRFIDTMEFEKIARNIRHYPNLIKKYEYKIQPKTLPVAHEQVNNLEESLNRLGEETKENKKIEYDEFFEDDNKEEYENTIQEQPTNSIEYKDSENPYNDKKVIDSIFKEIRKIELPQIKTVMSSKHKHKIIALFVMFVVLITVTLISVKSVPNIEQDNDLIGQMQDNQDDISEIDMLYGMEDNPSHQARLIPKQRDIDSFDIKAPVQSTPSYSPTVKNISWEVPESLVKKQNYTNFLQLAGKNIKLNLQNELLLVRDVPINRLISITIKIAANGDVQSVKLSQTSGSGAIDASINKVIKDTLKYMKPPAHGIIARPVSLVLTIELI